MLHCYYIALLCIGQVLLIQATAQYEGQAVISTTPITHDDVLLLRDILQQQKATLWEGPLLAGHPVKLMVSTEHVHSLLSDRGLTVHLEVDNVQEYYDSIRRDARNGDSFDFDIDEYNDYDTIMTELVAMTERCPEESGVICDLYDIGLSYEGRNLTVLRMRQFDDPDEATRRDDDTGKSGIWIDSLIHSGEWLGGATLLKIMDHMTRDYESDSEVAYLVNTYDWYFLPVMNPDGYEFSWYGVPGNPGWRKNRSPNEGSQCIGTDLNRNYDLMWMNAGSSDVPCSGNYAGSEAASEVETQAVQDEAVRLSSKMLSWTSIHCAGNMWMHSWGYVDDDGDCIRADDHDDLYYVATLIAEAIMATHDTTWTWGTVCETIYAASGSTIDYVKGGAGVKYTFTPELRAARPPPDQIQVSFEEIWNGFVAMVAGIEDVEQLP